MIKVKRLNSHLFTLKQIWLSVLLLLLTNSCLSQKINYLDIRDSIKTCGQAIDSLSINETLKRLESLDAHLLSKNIHVYYEDIAICYWVKARGKNEEYQISLSGLKSFQVFDFSFSAPAPAFRKISLNGVQCYFS